MTAGLGSMPFKIDRQGAKDAKGAKEIAILLCVLGVLGALAVKSLPIPSR